MGDDRKMTKEQEFRKQTEEAKFEAFSLMCKKVSDLEKENAELKAQVNEWLNAYSDTSLIKVLRDCIYKNEKLSSQEQQQLSAWVECAMDFGSNLDECANQLTKAKEIIKDLLGSENTSCEEEMFFEIRQKAEQFLNSEVVK